MWVWGGLDELKGLGWVFFGASTTDGITSVPDLVTDSSGGRVGVDEIVVEEPIDISSSMVD